ncbi:putative oligopeptide ABC transporter oligopeptide-binding protein [Ilumatobacter coccineus YM16-304]|uniref:Putative oligopeptide ABC transporter oligopeptide-binding protein n=2 Tax=Ilumatobacter coccineus TaxID=467094 RepID=A0A6C7E1Q1_ILUCY|nr:putative oligopeptide ABC transporter oligopeptide-binding protein [Ilumatobacter coccineus YM16-304]
MRFRARVPLAIALAFALVSCGSGGSGDDTDGAPTDAEPQSTASSDADDADDASATAVESSAEQSGTFRWGTTTMPATMDPTRVGSDSHIAYMLPVYDNLVRADADGNLIPGLATAWTLADDALSLDLSLREGVVFHDGEPFNAEAVIANFEHALSDDSLLAPVLNMIESMEAVDDLTVRIAMNRPGGDLPEILRGYAGMMASPNSILDGTIDQHPVGAGPFALTSINDNEATYERFAEYWDADNIHLAGMSVGIYTDDAARLNAVRTDQLDATFIRPNQLLEAEAAGLKIVTGPRVFIYGMYLNSASDVFSQPEVRQAISLAVDRSSIAEFYYDGGCTPTVQLYPEEYWAYSNDVDDAAYMTYDPDAAAAIIDEAFPDGLSFTILTNTVSNYVGLSEVMQEQFRQIGIDVTVEAIPVNESNTRVREGDYEIAVSALFSANPDPSSFALEYYQVGDTGTFIDPTVPELVERARLTADPALRAEAIGEITDAVLSVGSSMVGICIPDTTFVARTDVDGLVVPMNGNYDFRSVTVGE